MNEEQAAIEAFERLASLLAGVDVIKFDYDYNWPGQITVVVHSRSLIQSVESRMTGPLIITAPDGLVFAFHIVVKEGPTILTCPLISPSREIRGTAHY